MLYLHGFKPYLHIFVPKAYLTWDIYTTGEASFVVFCGVLWYPQIVLCELEIIL